MEKISATCISSYEMCPLQFFFNYELKLLQLPNPAFIIGTAYHKALELFHTGNSEEKIKYDIKELVESIEDYALVMGMFNKYKNNPIEGKTISNEFNFTQKVPMVDIPLFGYIDRIDEDKIVEYKTSSFDYKDENIKTLQSLIYTYVVYKQKGKILPVYYSVNNKKKVHNTKYVPQKLIVQYNENDMVNIEKKIQEFYQKVINEKDFKPKQGNHCYWCAYGFKGTNNCNHCI